jgi:hypothetical protein
MLSNQGGSYGRTLSRHGKVEKRKYYFYRKNVKGIDYLEVLGIHGRTM